MFSPELAPTFLAENPEYEGWGFVQARYYDNEAMKVLAEQDRDNNLVLQPLASKIVLEWSGSEEDKFNTMSQLEEIIAGEITVEDMCEYFDMSKRTAATWIRRYYA